MEFITTKRAVINHFDITAEIPFGHFQHLLNYQRPEARTEGIYGVNAYIYDFGDVAIVTGSRPYGNYKMAWNLINEYEDKAKAINNNRTLEYEERKNQVNALLNEVIKFIKKIIKIRKKENKHGKIRLLRNN